MIISLICFSSKELETDSEGIEVDIMTPFKDELRPKRKWKRKKKLAIYQRKKPKITEKTPSGCEYKSNRQLRHERRQMSKTTESHHFKMCVGAEKKKSTESLPTSATLNPPNASADDAETDYFSEGEISNTPSNYVQSCIREMASLNILTQVLQKCEQKGLTRHFMALMKEIASGKMPVTNISFLLALEVGLLHSLNNSTQMRYRDETTLFWEMALSVGGPRLLRLFSSDKHYGQVNSGKSDKSKYFPKDGSYNFAVPDERILQKSKTNIPKDVPCGIMDESLKLLSIDKEYILSLDGKQVGTGLKEQGVGDVNLWGFEGPPSLTDTLRFLHNETNNILAIADKINDQEDKTYLDPDILKDLKFVGEALSLWIKGLRQAKV